MIEQKLYFHRLENFLLELEIKLGAMILDYLPSRLVSAIEHGDLALVLLLQLGEHLVPVRSASICS